MPTVEETVQRKLTRAFIATQPVSIQLVPRQRVKQPSGGFKFEPMDVREPQVLRLVEPSAPAPPTRTLDGVERRVEFLLIGEYDALLGLYDVFTHDGAGWEVVFLYHFNGWERRAEVARRG